MFNQEKPEVAAAQKVMLDILKEIHKICISNDITYWLDAGTLLGALRHGGFIPWDDDCDVCMERAEYNRFIAIAQEHLPEGYFLQTKDTDSEYPLNFAKIRKLGTELIETGESGDEKYCHGIFVDIFPYDYYPSKWFVKWMNWGSTIRDKKKKYKHGSFQRLLVMLYTNVLLAIPVELTKVIRLYCEKHLDLLQNKEWDYCSYGIDCSTISPTLKKDIFPVKLAENVFENETFCIPNNSDGVMKSQYGDYMQLPPVEFRTTHAKRISI